MESKAKEEINANIKKYSDLFRLTSNSHQIQAIAREFSVKMSEIKERFDKEEKEKSANDIEASIPVSEFAEYCSALGEKRYSKAFDIRSRKTPSKSFFSSAYNYEGYKYNWIKEMYDKLGNSNDEFKKLYQGTWIDECTPITKSNFEKLMSIKKPNIYDKHSWINKEGKVKTSNVPPKRKDIQEREGLSYQYIDRTEIDCDWANELNKPKTKEMNKEIIGYKFKNESAHNKFTGVYKLLTIKSYLVSFPFPYKKEGFYTTKGCGYDVANMECNIFLILAKKYNLLDELFTPVYKKESNYKTELNKALDNIDKVRKALEKLDSDISKMKSND